MTTDVYVWVHTTNAQKSTLDTVIVTDQFIDV